MGTSYILTDKERVLADILLSIFYYYDFDKSPLPSIWTSHELISEKDISDLREKGILRKSKDEVYEDEVNKDAQHCIDLLGMYCPKEVKIVLFITRIKNTAKDLNIEEELLKQIVILHEIGHWISHKLVYNNTDWIEYLYNKKTVDVHEGLAQLYTWWVVDKFPELKEAFIKLNEHQPSPYLVWKYFINSSPKSLIILREYATVTKEEWLKYDFLIVQQPDKSLEEIINSNRGIKSGKTTGILD